MKVFYYSELLDKSFDTEQACLNAEKAHLDAEKGKKLAKDAVETAKENVRKAERKLQEVCDMAQELYDKKLAEAENDFEKQIAPAKVAVKEAKKQLEIISNQYADFEKANKVRATNSNKLWEDLDKGLRNSPLWDIFTY